MPAPLANRFLHYEVQPDLESFRRWALRQGVHEQVLAFLSFRPALLHKPDGKTGAWPSCRSWEMASELHEHELSITPAVGDGTAEEFKAYCKLYRSLPELESILQGRGTGLEFPKDPSLRYAIAIGLAVRAEKADEIQHSVKWMAANAPAEWCQLYVHSVQERAASRGLTGILAKAIAGEPSLATLIRDMAAAN
jgi:hypothetical protein